ncbi:MAG: repressor LexA [Candidatus Magasanikbacteria bacterium]|nr:repressor LexA [Candidatus Magasanikbacteria bacterium]
MSKEEYKNKIGKFYQKHKRMPSYSEIMSLLNFKSKNSVYELVNKLRKENFLDKDEKGKLIPKKIFGNTKILGTVEAGFPSPAEEELADTITLDEFLIPNKEATYILKVSGDSMKDAGIMEDDMVIVDRSAKPKNGDIVIAEVDGNWTMKFFIKKGNKIYLKAANKKYKDILPEEELKIAAVVKSVIRKY